MKKAFVIMCTVFAFAFFVGCSGDKSRKGNNAVDMAEVETSQDSTVYGVCGDATSMSVLQLITDKGDTLSVMLEGADTCSNVQGGLLAGDRLAVIVTKENGDELFAKSVLNITSLMGRWTSLDRSFMIEDGGVVTGDESEPNPYTEWKINNGRLVLSSDTFSVFALGPDSLLLENNKGIYAYKRVVNK